MHHQQANFRSLINANSVCENDLTAYVSDKIDLDGLPTCIRVDLRVDSSLFSGAYLLKNDWLVCFSSMFYRRNGISE